MNHIFMLCLPKKAEYSYKDTNNLPNSQITTDFLAFLSCVGGLVRFLPD